MKLYIYDYFVIIKWDLFIFNMNTFTVVHYSYQLPVMMNNEFMKLNMMLFPSIYDPIPRLHKL